MYWIINSHICLFKNIYNLQFTKKDKINKGEHCLKNVTPTTFKNTFMDGQDAHTQTKEDDEHDTQENETIIDDIRKGQGATASGQ